MDRKAHNFITKVLYGKEYDWIHAIKDAPVKNLGFKHRAAMHDEETNLLLILISKDLTVYFVSQLHDMCDKYGRDARETQTTAKKRRLKQQKQE
jgi:hypothetical protein